jgi:hypothetical protein
VDSEIPWAFDLLRNPDARADWERRHPGRAAEMRERAPLTEGLSVMAPTTKEENAWDDRATASAIAGARKVVTGSNPLMNTPVGRLSDPQWSWIVTGAIFGWIRTRVEQAIAEGIDQEQAVRLTGLTPSPCDVACVTSIMPALAEKAQIDWSQPLSAWPKDTMASFLLLAWQLIGNAEIARDQGPGKILNKSKDWSKEGDDIAGVPPPPLASQSS